MKYDITLLNYSNKFNLFFNLSIKNYSSIPNLVFRNQIHLTLNAALAKFSVWQKVVINYSSPKTVKAYNPSYKFLKTSTLSYLKSGRKHTLKSFLIRSNFPVSKFRFSLTDLKWSTSKAVLSYIELSRFYLANQNTHLLYLYTYLQILSTSFSIKSINSSVLTDSIRYKRLFTQNLLTL